MNSTIIDRKKLFPVVLSGLLLTGSFPLADISWLIWFALLPLTISIRSASLRQSFYLGFLTGVVHYLTLLYWIAGTLMTYGGFPLYLCLILLFLLAAYLAVYPALFAAGLSGLCKSPILCFIIFPFLWVSLEYLRSLLFSGFPWGLLGYSQYSNLNIIQFSDIFGVYGISFFIALANAAALTAFLYITGWKWHGRKVSKKLAGGSIIVLVIISGAIWSYGKWRIRWIDELAGASPSVKASIIQGNIDQSVKWNNLYQRSNTEKYINLSLQVKKDKPDIVVWPETATSFYFILNTELTGMVKAGILKTGSDFLIGSPSIEPINNNAEYFNSAYLIDSGGNVQGKYSKAHLVPFGEYIPFHKWLPFLGKMVEGVGDFRPGKIGNTLFGEKYNLGVLICYELIFPDLARAMVANNASLLINITNDAWYGRSCAPYQHFSMAVFRAVENRRSLIRAANTGISGFIDPAGRIVAKTDIFEEAVSTHSAAVISKKTFYTRFGYLFAVVCLAVTLFTAILLKIKKAFFKNAQK